GPRIFYKFDNGRYEELNQIGTSFIIPKKLTDFTDNEHSITVYALDINGVRGPEFTRNFRISLEEPKGSVLTPPISETVKQTVKMTGIATDKNGIKAVYISVDNGNSYNEAKGNYGHEMTQCNWSYEFDTRVIEDGTHVVFMKVVDWYGIEGLYSSLINIDNTAPKIDLMLPLDDSKSTGMVFFSGQTIDNIELTKLYITIRSLEGRTVSSKLARTDLTPDEIITQALDISNLEDGFYNIELTGVDAAQNITRVSRNIKLDKKAPKAKVDLLYPLNGEHVQGTFNIYGTAVSENEVQSLTLFVDGKNIAQTELSESGYFKFTLDQTMIAEGKHDIRVEAFLADTSKIISNTQYLNYGAVGPWITIDNFTYGDFAIERPYIIGNSGYSWDEEEVVRANAKGASKELKEAVASKSVESVELSLDNGKTFKKLSSNGKWRYRVENEDIAEGYHFLLVRAKMKNGEVAVTRCIVQVDSTKPTIKLISPGAGGHYNQLLEFSGLAKDDVALKSLTLALRQGDKSSYEIPAFIQGLYFDWQFWGATLFNVGAGLTFFDDNVKLQVQWGQFTQQQRALFDDSAMRYGGDNVFGMKLLANVFYMPFRYYLGPDWEWLSLNVAVGANFTRFNETGSGKAQILSAGLLQLEFPRITFSKQKMFRTIAFYTEGQLWFIPTDVSSEEDVKSLVPQISFGLRVNVF
ncbi:MAG: neuraminidase, partial [Treponema sp.]|nr:neuraminidase [Treponema sp.]